MKRTIACLAISASLLLPAGAVFATGQPGSPNVLCLSGPTTSQTPGNSGSATNPGGTNGSPFNQAIAKKYAGNPNSPTTAIGTHASPNAISQYDIACLHVTTQVP